MRNDESVSLLYPDKTDVLNVESDNGTIASIFASGWAFCRETSMEYGVSLSSVTGDILVDNLWEASEGW